MCFGSFEILTNIIPTDQIPQLTYSQIKSTMSLCWTIESSAFLQRSMKSNYNCYRKHQLQTLFQ